MNKIDLIQAMKGSNHLSKSEAYAVVNLVSNEIADALAQGDRVEIRGLCSFFIKNYPFSRWTRSSRNWWIVEIMKAGFN